MQRHKLELRKRLGPGGINCPCCGPPPSARKALYRAIKRKLRQEWRKDAKSHT